MSPTQFKRVRELFDDIGAMPPDRRASALDRAREQDSLVADEVDRLLSNVSKQDAVAFEHRIARQIDRALAASDTLRPPSAESIVGQRVGPYEILKILGQGGMGIVYLGRDTKLGRLAALKSVRCLDGTDGTAGRLVDRLKREAMLLASLSHPNLATVYGLEATEADGDESGGATTLFIAMEFIDGPTLASRIGRRPMSIADALAACAQIAAAVEAAHEAGVIHRDLKPENVMFTSGTGSKAGTLKVLDFGLARQCVDVKLAGDRSSTASPSTITSIEPPQHLITRAGVRIGTPGYMSPEQVRGEPLDARSDIFTFGLILYRCLTGQDAFRDDAQGDVADAILNRDPDTSALPSRLPDSVRNVLKRCLAKAAVDRYRHIGDARLDLLAALASRECDRREPREGSSLRWLTTAAALAVGAISIGLAATMTWHRTPAPSAAIASAGAQQFEITFPEEAQQGAWNACSSRSRRMGSRSWSPARRRAAGSRSGSAKTPRAAGDRSKERRMRIARSSRPTANRSASIATATSGDTT